LRLPLQTQQSPGEVLEFRQPHGEFCLAHDGQAALTDLRGLGDRAAGQVRAGDALADHRGPLSFGRGKAAEQVSGDLLGVIELADLQAGGDAEGVEPVPVQEPGPRAVLVRVGDTERLLGPAPGLQRLSLVAEQRALLGVARGDPCGRRR
jgi:hypothetical protein